MFHFRSRRRRMALLPTAMLTGAVLMIAACGDAGGGATTAPPLDPTSGGGSPSAVGPGLSVADALASTLDQPLLVNGFVLAREGEVRLCQALLESFPPQCGAPSIAVAGLDLDAFEWLTTADGVSWSDQPVQLLGTVSGDVLTVASNVSATGS